MYSLKALLITALFASSYATPISSTANGVACTIARIQILSALDDAGESVGKIKEPPVAAAASAGITRANDGIAQIAKAVLSGQPPPAASRNDTKDGLDEAAKALADGDMSDPAVVAAQGNIKEAKQAGDDVVANC